MFPRNVLGCAMGATIAMALLCSCGEKKSVANANKNPNHSATLTAPEKKVEVQAVALKENEKREDPRVEDVKKVLSKIFVYEEKLDTDMNDLNMARKKEAVRKERYDNSIKLFNNEAKIAQKDLTEQDYKDFLTQLEKVLLWEKDNANPDDISLFYLADKDHFILGSEKAAANYAPKGLTKVTNCKYYNVNKDGMSLRPESHEALQKLAEAANLDGVGLTVSSTYRDYKYQSNLFNYWVSVDGLIEAERESARAGTSQHQLGTAVDFAPVSDSFDRSKEGQWLKKAVKQKTEGDDTVKFTNAMKYGWSLSFPTVNHEDVTGFKWESWHFRYIGVPACELQYDWFHNIQQYMVMFIDEWRKTDSYRSFKGKYGIPDFDYQKNRVAENLNGSEGYL